MISLTNIIRTCRMGGMDICALCGVSLQVGPGELIAVMGPSGSGKSTVMNVIGCLDRPTSGSFRFEDREVGTMTDDELAHLRNHPGRRQFPAYPGLRDRPSHQCIALVHPACFFFSVAVGVFFGVYPARKAALQDPIQAPRYE